MVNTAAGAGCGIKADQILREECAREPRQSLYDLDRNEWRRQGILYARKPCARQLGSARKPVWCKAFEYTRTNAKHCMIVEDTPCSLIFAYRPSIKQYLNPLRIRPRQSLCSKRGNFGSYAMNENHNAQTTAVKYGGYHYIFFCTNHDFRERH